MELEIDGIVEEHEKSELGRRLSEGLHDVYVVVFDDWEDGYWKKKVACEKSLNTIVRRHLSDVEIYRNGRRIILSSLDIEKIEKELEIENRRAKELSDEYWRGWWKGILYAKKNKDEEGLKERARASLEAIRERTGDNT